jgi:transposase-like protein
MQFSLNRPSTRHPEKGKSRVRTAVIPGTKRGTLQTQIEKHVADGAKVYTDSLPSYDGLRLFYDHAVINHAEKYAEGEVHTNGMENFWSLLKRTVKGTYVSVEPFHLFRYLDEQAFRFNEREGTDADRFRDAIRGILGRRLTYDALTANTERP